MAFDKQSTFDKVIQVVSDKLNKDKDSIMAAHSFEELGADSLDMVEIVLTLEEQFNIEINDEDAEKLTSIQQVVDYIHNLRSE